MPDNGSNGIERYMLLGVAVSAWLYCHPTGNLTMVWRDEVRGCDVTKTRFFSSHEDAAQFFDDLDYSKSG